MAGFRPRMKKKNHIFLLKKKGLKKNKIRERERRLGVLGTMGF